MGERPTRSYQGLYKTGFEHSFSGLYTTLLYIFYLFPLFFTLPYIMRSSRRRRFSSNCQITPEVWIFVCPGSLSRFYRGCLSPEMKRVPVAAGAQNLTRVAPHLALEVSQVKNSVRRRFRGYPGPFPVWKHSIFRGFAELDLENLRTASPQEKILQNVVTTAMVRSKIKFSVSGSKIFSILIFGSANLGEPSAECSILWFWQFPDTTFITEGKYYRQETQHVTFWSHRVRFVVFLQFHFVLGELSANPRRTSAECLDFVDSEAVKENLGATTQPVVRSGAGIRNPSEW